jgi:hypothetical protein
VCLLRLHLNLNFQHPLLDLVKFGFPTFRSFVVHSHLKEVDPLVKFLIFFLEVEDELSIGLPFVKDWL